MTISGCPRRTLVPGATIALFTGEGLGTVKKEFTVKAGEKVELPDVSMKRTAELYEAIYHDLPSEAQYIVPFAFKIRWYMKMNLREALHLCELRTTPQGHPDYRFICQEMWRKIQSVHPALAESGKFMDWEKYRLGRLQSEMCGRSLRSRRWSRKRKIE